MAKKRADTSHELRRRTICRAWRSTAPAAPTHPPSIDVDLPSLADQVFTAFQGGFILALATDEPDHLRRQLAHVRQYLELLFQLAPVRGSGAAVVA